MHTTRTLCLAALSASVWAWSHAASVEAQATPLRDPSILNAATTGNQTLPAVTATPDGGFAVIWLNREGSQDGISARLLDAAGEPVGDDIVLEPPQTHPLSSPRIVARTESELVAAWSDWTFLTPPLPIRRFARDGTILGDLESPEEDDGFLPFGQDLAALADGGLVLTWFQGPGDAGVTNEQIYARRYAPCGEAGPSFQVNTTDLYYYGRQEKPSIAVGGGEFIVVWEDEGFSSPMRGLDIGYRRYSTDGVALGTERYLEPYGRAYERAEPRVAASSSGDFVVTWTERAEPMTDLDVWVQRFARPNARASPIAGAPFRVNDATAGDQQAPDIAMDADGNFIIVWRSDVVGSQARIEGRLFHRSGRPVGSAFLIATGASPDTRPSVALSESDRSLVVWHAPGTHGDDTDITGRAYATAFSNCAQNARTLCLQQDRFQVRVTWRDFDGKIGTGHTVPITSEDSGLFWFFSPSNWELLVKVLDGCDLNQNFWVFAAATTNVEYTLKVTDTLTGEERDYENLLGVSAPAITDTAAFSTCSVDSRG